MKKSLLLLPAIALLAAGCHWPWSSQTVWQTNTSGSTAGQSQNPSGNPGDQTSPPDQTQTPTPEPTPASSKVQITLSPTSGLAGTKVTVTGQGFTPTGNLIAFGDFGGRHHPDGTGDNVIASVSSADGTHLTFTVPASGPSGILCDSANNCIGVTAIKLAPGNYNVLVSNANGASNVAVFTLK